MSLGDLVIGLSADTARFQADMGKAAQMLERFGSISKLSSKAAQEAMKDLGNEGVASILRLQRSFNSLNIKSQLQIDYEKKKLQENFNAIKNSGVASADEISRAYKALQQKMDQLDGKDVGHKMNMNLVASLGTIAKMQIMFSLINQTMSAIGSMPGIAVDAIENFNAQIVGNAAMITSMQGGVEDIGEAYKKNKVYAESVQNVLVKMDSETSASAKNLNDMNTQLIQQGIILDVNSEKQKESFKSIANALSAITANDTNKDMQFAQEVRALRDFQDKGSNRLVQLLSAQGVTKEMLDNWKKIGQETNNYGYVLEKIAPYLSGFAAAQGDINNLWETTKSTMVTIRDEVLRGGLSQGFGEIVKFMKEMSKSAEENKFVIQEGLNKGFLITKGIVASLVNIFETFKPVLSPIVDIVGFIAKGWGLMAAVALPTITEKMQTMVVLGQRIGDVFAKLLVGDFKGAKFAASSAFTEFEKLDDYTNFVQRYADYNKTFKVNTSSAKVEMPTNLRVSSGKTTTSAVDNSLYNFNNKLNSYFDSSELDSYEKGLEKINSEYMKMVSEYNALSKADKAWEDKDREGGTLGALERTKKALEENLKLKEQMKGESLLSEFEKFKNNGELDTLDKQLANIDVQAKSFVEKIQKASSATKEWLELKGVNKDNILKVFEEIKEKAKITFKIKMEAAIEDMKTQIMDIKSKTLGLFESENPETELKVRYREESYKYDKEIDKLEAIEKRNEEEEKLLQAHYERLKALDDKYAADKKRLTKAVWEQGAESISNTLGTIGNVLMQGNKKQFEDGKKMAIAAATINTYLAASKALSNAPNIYVGMIAAAGAIAMGTQQVAMISSQHYEAREKGGPVTAGKSYIVGEKRPELFTPGATGVITPYVPEGGGKGVEVTNVYQISTGVADTVRSEIARLAPSLTQMSVNAVRNAIQNGEFNGAMA